jgi:hypothetical protein
MKRDAIVLPGGIPADADVASRSSDTGADAAAHGSSAARARAASIGRRALLGGLAVAAGGAAGVAAGYRFRTELRGLKLGALAAPLSLPEGMNEFRADAERIEAAHRRQTAADVAALKAKYEGATFGRVHAWDLFEKLAFCVDPTDLRLFCGSQFIHSQQILAAMEANGVVDGDMLLLAIVHDLGKVLLLRGEAPEHVVCGTRRIVGGEPGAGLDRVVFQFGHGEFIHSRLVGHVPEHVAWVARYHNVSLREVEPFLNEQERVWTERYLRPFREFDGDFVSPYFLPRVDLERYRALVESYFPSPILV